MQERAARTRELIVRVAAARFARDGFEGVTYRQIAAAADVSVGSLTFHFASKAELADTIQAQGAEAARQALGRVTDRGGPALRQVVDITVELTRLLEEDVRAWAALRLLRERRGPGLWSGLWVPTVQALLVQAHEAGQLRESVRPEDLLTLVEHLVGGAEAHLRERIGTRQEDEDAAVRLRRVWRLVWEGLSPTAPAHPQGVPVIGPPRGADAAP